MRPAVIDPKSQDMRPPRCCVGVPVFNEEEVLPELLARLSRELDALPGGPHSMLFVDDGSSDHSVEVLRAAAAKDSRIRVVSLSRNFGHQVAVTAAIDHADGDVLVLMDADLQDPPEAIRGLVDKHLEGYDVVWVRRVRRKESWFLRTCYWIYYRIAAAVADAPLRRDSGDFSLMSRRVVEALRTTRERQRYVRGLRSWAGFRQVGVDVERAKRAAGEPKYSMLKLIKLGLDGIFAFSVLPLRLAAASGALAMAGALAYFAYALVVKLARGDTPPGFTSLVAVVVFLSGVQLLFLGVIGEYVGRIYQEVKARPLYLVRDTFGGPAKSG